MDQHHVQEAYLKAFEDSGGQLWLYGKDGGRPFRRPAKHCTAEEDFQLSELEIMQGRLIETPGIRALRETDFLGESEYNSISSWMALHILRNVRSYTQLFRSGDDYNTRFNDELAKELLFSGYFRFVFTYQVTDPAQFLLTCDSPVIEFAVGDHFVRCCSVSPQKMILFSPIDDRPTHELRAEDFFNAMVWANAVEYVFAHRGDVAMTRFKDFADTYRMHPDEEDIRFEL